ncbi:MAG: hypothetical protein Q9198_010077, partial [Flavoplaca austrocitrina]
CEKDSEEEITEVEEIEELEKIAKTEETIEIEKTEGTDTEETEETEDAGRIEEIGDTSETDEVEFACAEQQDTVGEIWQAKRPIYSVRDESEEELEQQKLANYISEESEEELEDNRKKNSDRRKNQELVSVIPSSSTPSWYAKRQQVISKQKKILRRQRVAAQVLQIQAQEAQFIHDQLLQEYPLSTSLIPPEKNPAYAPVLCLAPVSSNTPAPATSLSTSNTSTPDSSYRTTTTNTRSSRKNRFVATGEEMGSDYRRIWSKICLK